jgi:hypothetical protein
LLGLAPDHSLARATPECGAVYGRVVLALAATACGDSPTRPTPAALTISCPAAQTVQSLDGLAVTVAFAAPVVTGGTSPVTTTCTRQSGARFEVGTTDVACLARDAVQRAASCSFRIAVVTPPKLNAKFLALATASRPGAADHLFLRRAQCQLWNRPSLDADRTAVRHPSTEPI